MTNDGFQLMDYYCVFSIFFSLIINDKLHLVDYYYMDVESELYDYGILYAFDVPGLDNWFGSWVWWFVQGKHICLVW